LSQYQLDYAANFLYAENVFGYNSFRLRDALKGVNMIIEKTLSSEMLPYRACVGVAVFNLEGKVWIGRRHLRRHDEIITSTKLWQLPQGGIDNGEDPLRAAYRELWEETGMHSVELAGESNGWIEYDLPNKLIGIALHGKYRGQRQKWFAMRFVGPLSEIAINPLQTGNKVEFDDWTWVDLEEIPYMVVSFKQVVYEKVVAQFRTIAYS